MPGAEGFAEDLNCVKKEQVFCIVVLMQAGRTQLVCILRVPTSTQRLLIHLSKHDPPATKVLWIMLNSDYHRQPQILPL